MAIDIQTRKLHLIEDITRLNDPLIIAKVEDLLRTAHEEKIPKPYDLSDIKGLLSAEEAEKYHRNAQQTRDEWEKGI